jgi:hypothetical protein
MEDIVGRKVSSLQSERPDRKQTQASAADRGRDWFDWATLATAAVGAVVVVMSTVLTQLDSAESGRRAAESLNLLTQQARASETQASAATKMAGITSEQLDGLRIQLGEMKSQSTALSASAEAANHQLRQASRHNRVSVRPIVGFDRDGAVGADVGIYVYNSGTGPAMIRDLEVYLDGKKLNAASDLENVELRLFRSATAKWVNIRGQRTIKPSERMAIYYTESANISDMNAFRNLIQNRISMIAKSCSLYEECEYVCSTPDVSANLARLPRKFRECS